MSCANYTGDDDEPGSSVVKKAKTEEEEKEPKEEEEEEAEKEAGETVKAGISTALNFCYTYVPYLLG